MGTIYERGKSGALFFGYKDEQGKWVYKKSPYKVGQEKRARAALAALERRIEAARKLGTEVSGPLTVKAYGEKWLEKRPGQGVATAKDEAARIRKHAWPAIGSVLLKDLRPHHIRDLIRALRVKKTNRGTPMAPRSVRRIYEILHSMLHDAVADELIDANPCVLKKGELPGKKDRDPKWRSQAQFTRDEAEQIISDERIPEDRRVVNALHLLAGLRPGEAAALRWRDYDPDTEPLGRLSVTASWDSHERQETTTKTEEPRDVPVHPTLAAILARWKLSGFKSIFGRKPQPEDLIVPNRDLKHRSAQRALRRHHEDLDKLGLRHRRQHDGRRTFITLARADGGDAEGLLHFVTHGRKGTIIDEYTTPPWEPLCRCVTKLKIQFLAGKIIEMPKLATAGAVGRAGEDSRGGLTSTLTSTDPGAKKKPQDLATLGPLLSSSGKRGSNPSFQPVSGASERLPAPSPEGKSSADERSRRQPTASGSKEVSRCSCGMEQQPGWRFCPGCGRPGS